MFKKRKPDYMRLQKVKAKFVTTDGVTHNMAERKWVNRDGISCSVEEYLTDRIIRDGYIKDEKFVIYPIANIMSIEWSLINERLFEENTNPYRSIFYTDEELEKLVPYEII